MKHSAAIQKELFTYTVIGGIATIIDWSVFAIAVTFLKVHYLPALMLAFSTAGIFHYIANKMITFKCVSKKFASQISIYLLVMMMSLGLNMLIMVVLVKLFVINKIILRMLTTLLMLLPNYLLHKHVTFSKKIFAANKSV